MTVHTLLIVLAWAAIGAATAWAFDHCLNSTDGDEPW